jgi:hypothetical protein
MRSHRALGGLAAAVVLSLSALAGASAPAGSAPTWAPAATATVHPGVMMFTDGAQCTANLVYTDAADNVYLGYAAHCAGTGAATDTNGCDAGTLPIGTPVEIDGAGQRGTLAYSSWVTMQAVGETNPDACAYNDLALVRIHPDDVDSVNPSIPHWGGPTGVNTTGNPVLSRVHSYGNSSLRQGIAVLSPKTGVSLGTSGGGWTHPVYTASPGIPGDSGSAMLDASGRASGVLSTLAIAPMPASNNFSDLNLAVQYMRGHGGPQASVVLGTEPFNGGRLPIGGLGL